MERERLRVKRKRVGFPKKLSKLLIITERNTVQGLLRL